MKFSWFPGHMKKALRQLESYIKLVDMVLLILDARIPSASLNPDLQKLIGGRRCVYILNKADLAEQGTTSRWTKYFASTGQKSLAISANTSGLSSKLVKVIEAVRDELIELRSAKNRCDRDVKIMVLGIPNAGKSTVINNLAGKSVVSTGKKAGLTRGLQWISIRNDIKMLDVPGIFYPRLKDETEAWHLASTGAAREVAFPVDELSCEILLFLQSRNHPFTEGMPDSSMEEMLAFAGKKQNFILKQAKVDYERTAMWLITGFRDGKFGRFSLEEPPVEEV